MSGFPKCDLGLILIPIPFLFIELIHEPCVLASMGRSRIYENQVIPQSGSQPRREVDVSAGNKSMEVVVLYEVPNN